MISLIHSAENIEIAQWLNIIFSPICLGSISSMLLSYVSRVQVVSFGQVPLADIQ